jgi:hypothetical protein
MILNMYNFAAQSGTDVNGVLFDLQPIAEATTWTGT